MKFPVPVLYGTLIKRYKRFLADIELENGELITAHCANPGSMKGMNHPGLRVWVMPATNPNRKLKYDWLVAELGTAKVCIHTGLANGIVEEAILSGSIAELQGYKNLRREVKYGQNSRIDILVEDEGRAPCYVEVKNVTLSREAGTAEFPDSPTARGTKHLHELAHMVEGGARAVMFYLVNRTDAERFRLASDIDPTYKKAFDMASSLGVERLVYGCDITPSAIVINRALKL